MNTLTPSPPTEKQTRRREPLRWLVAAALLLAFLSICCVAEVTMRLLEPHNVASSLNLLSQDSANYRPWENLGLGAIPPQLPAAQAADRATATVAAAGGTPTPALVGVVPTAPVEIVPEPINFPTATPGDQFVVTQPTATPREAGQIPTNPPATVQPPATQVASEPTDDAPTQTPSTASATPTRTQRPRTDQPTDTPRPTLTSVPPTSTERPTLTETSAPAVTATNTSVPPTSEPPTSTSTNVPPTSVPSTPVPPTATNTPRPRPTTPPTPTEAATATPTTAPTVAPTNTPTNVPPTNTPTPGVQPADVTIAKNGPASVLQGLDIAYLLTVSNNGPGAATNVVVTDTPSGVAWTFVPATSDPTCASNGTTITCNIGSLAAGGSRSVTVTLRPGSVGTLSNTAAISASESDPVPGNNSATAQTRIDPPAQADVRISKVGPATANANDTITYNLTVNNDGPSTATSVVVDDTPSGVAWTFNSGSFSSVTFPTGACVEARPLIRCLIGSIPAGGSVDITIRIRVDAGGVLRNTADVSAAELDANGSNNTASATTTVSASSIPGVTVTNSSNVTTAVNDSLGPPPVSGTDVTYTIVIGNSTGGDLTVTSLTTSFGTFVVNSCPSVPAGSGCSIPAVQPGGTFRWIGPVTITNGGSITIQITGRFVSAPVGSSQCFPAFTLVTSAGTATRPSDAPCITVTG